VKPKLLTTMRHYSRRLRPAIRSPESGSAGRAAAEHRYRDASATPARHLNLAGSSWMRAHLGHVLASHTVAT